MKVIHEDRYTGSSDVVQVEYSYEEEEISARTLLLARASDVLKAEHQLLVARAKLRRHVAYLRSDDASTPFTRDHLTRLLGRLYPADVEEVRDRPEVAQEDVEVPQPQARPLAG